MTTYTQLPLAEWQIIAPDGGPAVGYLAYTYIPNTLTPMETFQDSSGLSANTNPIVLDSNGMAVVWASSSVRVILKNTVGVQIYDQVTSPYLNVTAISAAMAPVVAAGSTSQARTLLGVDSEIASAIEGVSLIPGPQGIQGTQGIQGVQGVAGVQGPQGVPGTDGGSGLWNGSGGNPTIGSYIISQFQDTDPSDDTVIGTVLPAQFIQPVPQTFVGTWIHMGPAYTLYTGFIYIHFYLSLRVA